MAKWAAHLVHPISQLAKLAGSTPAKSWCLRYCRILFHFHHGIALEVVREQTVVLQRSQTHDAQSVRPSDERLQQPLEFLHSQESEADSDRVQQRRLEGE